MSRTSFGIILLVQSVAALLFSAYSFGLPLRSPSQANPKTFSANWKTQGNRTKLAAVESSPLIFKKVQISLKFIYAHVRQKKYIDPRLNRDVPSLRKKFDFNAYRLIKSQNKAFSLASQASYQFSKKYQFSVKLLDVLKASDQIVLQATFSHRRKVKNKWTYKAYVSTKFKLRNHKMVAFLGPTYKNGRVLITLRASH